MLNIKLNKFIRMDLNFENTIIAFCYKKTNELMAFNAHQQKAVHIIQLLQPVSII